MVIKKIWEALAQKLQFLEMLKKVLNIFYLPWLNVFEVDLI